MESCCWGGVVAVVAVVVEEEDWRSCGSFNVVDVAMRFCIKKSNFSSLVNS